MPAALVVLAGVEDASVARAESHYNIRSNSQCGDHVNFNLVSEALVCVISKSVSRIAASGTTFVFAARY